LHHHGDVVVRPEVEDREHRQLVVAMGAVELGPCGDPAFVRTVHLHPVRVEPQHALARVDDVVPDHRRGSGALPPDGDPGVVFGDLDFLLALTELPHIRE